VTATTRPRCRCAEGERYGGLRHHRHVQRRTRQSLALENGDRLTRAEFERRYEAMPHLKKAELIEGVVYVPSPVRHRQHGAPHAHLTGWLGQYAAHTPGIEAGDNSLQATWILQVLPFGKQTIHGRSAFRRLETLKYTEIKYVTLLNGIQHVDHLRRVGGTVYARQVTERKREEARWVRGVNPWTAYFSRSERVLGDLDADAGQHDRAHQHYDTAVQIAHGISAQGVLIEVLLARGRWAARWGDVAAAWNDLEEALNYAVSSGYRIYEADIRVGLAWLYLNRGNPAMAGQEAARAKRMSENMGYHWGRVDAEGVFDRLQSGG
jgi:hypothetical protein